MQNEIRCPHCGQSFTVNESEYASLLEQVRTKEFDKELHARLTEKEKGLKVLSEKALQELKSQKELEIQELQNKLASQKDQFATEKELATKEVSESLQKQLADREKEVQELKSQKEQDKLKYQNDLQAALVTIEKELQETKNQLTVQETENKLSMTSLQQDYENKLKVADEQIAFYKDFKAKQSTKAIGESLEQYAESEFNKVRSYAFPNAYFEKDNQVSKSSHSKGDFIFREKDENGVEILSIMFEMKNEADETAKKHKNSDFYKELDKDRREKKCEYAVLVTMLESDNDYFNTGIVDVSHEYDKMYVVRPQFFIQLIGILRNAAMNALQYKRELALTREQNIDITHFEEDLDHFKTAFAKNYTSAKNNFESAIDEIDKAIRRMEAVKKSLTTSQNQLRLANNKLDDVSVKKLTRKNPTMKAQFEALKDKTK